MQRPESTSEPLSSGTGEGRGRLRVGVVGTGYWARWCHGSVLSRRDDLTFVGFYGRDLSRAQEAADENGGQAFDDLAEFMTAVDAVSFAVPPDAQARLATRAAHAGKHLLLDKPMALDVPAAHELTYAVSRSGVVTVCFMTLLFQSRVREWIHRLRLLEADSGPWEGMAVTWAGSIDVPGGHYAESRWRHEKGGLWDLGPHALSLIGSLMPPVESLSAVRGVRDCVHVALKHQGGPLSSMTLTVTAPAGAQESLATIWGPGGRHELTLPSGTLREAFGRAVDVWVDAVAEGGPTRLDASYGGHLVGVLDLAERDLLRPREIVT